MKFCVLALDYDGTIAHEGTLHPDVRGAIAEVRARGIVVILVTGRILRELRDVAGDLRFVDAVVGENGAVLAFPRSGRSMVLGRQPPPVFLPELARRGIDVAAGECVVQADASLAPGILAVIRELELPLVLLFNRGRLMALPQAISKATGLREALRALRLSAHNTVAIGDAENDHELLGACELGVAVGWGSEALKAVADEVLEGSGPAAVAGYIRRLAAHPKLSPKRAGRHHLLLGSAPDGTRLELDEQGHTVLITGEPRSGKSWVAGLLCEQMVLHQYSVCVIDPEGDYRLLESLPGVTVLGGDDPAPRPRDITRALRHPDVSLVVDLSKMVQDDKGDYVTSLLALLAGLRRDSGLPHRIIVDEAHYFLHRPNARHSLDLELGGYTLVTFRPSGLPRDVLMASDAIIAKRETDPREVHALLAVNGATAPQEGWEAVLGALAMDEAILFPDPADSSGRPLRFRVAPRLVSHVRHRQKYLDMPVAEREAFVFCRHGMATGQRARTLREFIALLAAAPCETLDGHLRRGDFSRWIADIYKDRPLAAEIRELENQYQFDRVLDINDALVELIQEHYAVTDEGPEGLGYAA